jgi:hypothetical protein
LHRLLHGLAVAAIVTQPWAHADAVAQMANAAPADMQRGDAVEVHYHAYLERLQRYNDALRSTLAADAPDLLPMLKAVAPPSAVPHGYGVLPKLVADAPRPQQSQPAAPAWYSWPWTDDLIERDAHTLDGLTADLESRATLSPHDRRATCARSVAAYRTLSDHHRTIDAHVQYNHLWQRAIANDKPGYDRQTTLYNTAVERQAILAALHASDEAAFRNALRDLTVVDSAKPRKSLETDLREREHALTQAIDQATGRITPPPFVRLSHPSPHRWIVDVPVYTDVADASFVRRFKQAVETVWRLREGGDEFQLRATIIRMPVSRLYRSSSRPRRGTAVDANGHCAQFPQDGAALTTGAIATHVALGRCIVLGPQDISPHTLAHEFGHVLGFWDVYFRGYRDLGPDGYQVMEIAADPDDIMGAPGTGPVLRRHFERLIATKHTAEK